MASPLPCRLAAPLALVLTCVAPLAATAGLPVITPPSDAVVVDFDDFTAPAAFAETLATSTQFSMYGVVFSGTGNSGGAVLSDASGMSLSGYSAPNFLAFKPAAPLNSGGTASFPEAMTFRRPVSYVQFNVGDAGGQMITAEAFDADDNSLGSAQITAAGAMQTLVLEARHIAKVVVTSGGAEVIIDDLAFVLDTTVINFDESPAPGSFNAAFALRDEYDNRSVEFYGNQNDGAAILSEASAIPVTGYSPPNFLAINSGEFLTDNGVPGFPVFMQFFPPVKKVEFLIADPSEATVHVEAKTAGEVLVDSVTVELEAGMKLVVLEGPSITSVRVTSEGSTAVIDDLGFLVEGTLIDFDDNTNPANIFNEATALRERYAGFGVHFTAPGNDGPAVLAFNAGMGTELHSPANVLAADSTDQLANGAIPQLPLTVEFDRPLQRVELRVADPNESRLFFEGRDAADHVTLTSDIFTKARFEHIPLYFEGTTKLIITSNGNKAFLDDLAFLEMPECEHNPCYQGVGLLNHCSPCVTKVCAEDLSCCGEDGWGQSCAEMTDTVCETFCEPLCGDANVDRKVSAPDALIALKTAVGDGTVCAKSRCDFTGDDKILSGDALQILRTAVGQPTNPNCPPDP